MWHFQWKPRRLGLRPMLWESPDTIMHQEMRRQQSRQSSNAGCWPNVVWFTMNAIMSQHLNTKAGTGMRGKTHSQINVMFKIARHQSESILPRTDPRLFHITANPIPSGRLLVQNIMTKSWEELKPIIHDLYVLLFSFRDQLMSRCELTTSKICHAKGRTTRSHACHESKVWIWRKVS
jgi:hypothetical protein